MCERAKSTLAGCWSDSRRGCGPLSKRPQRPIARSTPPYDASGAPGSADPGHRTPVNTFFGLIALVLSLGTALAPTGSGAAQWPLNPRPSIVARFDPPGSTYGAGHRGVDLLGRPGEPVLAALGGRITFAGNLAGRGVVVIDHGQRRTTYEPVLASVHVGDQVGAGDELGTLETGGSHCFPRACLHWGLIQGDEYLDPLSLVGAGGPVRLLPLASIMPADAPAGTRSADAPW